MKILLLACGVLFYCALNVSAKSSFLYTELFSHGISENTVAARHHLSLSYLSDVTRNSSNAKIDYQPAIPSQPKGNEGQNCSSDAFIISSTLEGSKEGLTFQWQYHISGSTKLNPEFYSCQLSCESALNACEKIDSLSDRCGKERQRCSDKCRSDYPEFVDNWLDLTSGDLTLSFNPLDFFGGNFSIVRVQFRVKAINSNMSTSISESSVFFTFLPPSPNSTTTPIIENSCISPTGKITVSNISGINGGYQYLLKKGDINKLGCHPKVCDAYRNGKASDTELQLSEIGVGTYSLFLVNYGDDLGFCATRIGGPIVIDAIPSIGIKSLSQNDLICNGINSGQVEVTIQGGKPEHVAYILTNTSIQKDYLEISNTKDAMVLFDGLTAGDHLLIIDDGCTNPVSSKFSVREPAKIAVNNLQNIDATCNGPANGVAIVNASRTTSPFIMPISNLTIATLFKDDVLFDLSEKTGLDFQWNTLSGGKYSVILLEKGSNDCNADTVDFLIRPAETITIRNEVLLNVSCYNGSDGSIQVTGSGGTGSFNYDMIGVEPRTSLSGDFFNLKSGTYFVTIKNTIACDDAFVSPPIYIAQPSQVSPTIKKSDISCFGLDDGFITSSVVGGVSDESYSYSWELLVGDSWISMGKLVDGLSNLSPGAYRLKASDIDGCIGVSNEVVILEPELLTIDSVNVHDIACLGQFGKIDILTSGGTEPYSYEFSKDNQPFEEQSENTQLEEGNYLVATTDKNGCRVERSDRYVISSPPSKLQFSKIVSDYHGYNISCFNGSNGFLNISANGGNGSNYSGYSFSIDEKPYSSESMIHGINAGIHTVKVRDGRGCTVTENVEFTQASEVLTASLKEKQDVVCFTDSDGVLNFSAKGGLSPYSYSLSSSRQQSDGLFRNLSVGDYVLMITDKNNCTSFLKASITNLNPKMVIDSDVKNVSCFGGNDGEIGISVTGGVAPFIYQWSQDATYTSKAASLAIGNYTILITDALGCKMDSVITVNGPEGPLKMNLNVLPVCFNKANGSVSVSIVGGTSPYRVSLDGNHYQSELLFSTVGAGMYNVSAIDNNNCDISQTVEVIQRNDKPEPNFLAATKRNALDTLVITDISIPKPDSIEWTFVPAPEIISDDMWSPIVKYAKPGKYLVSLTGYFGGCDYTVVKELVLNPFDPQKANIKSQGYKPIQDVSVSPNPSTGEFEVQVKLNEQLNVSLLVYDLIGDLHYFNSFKDVNEVIQKVELSGVATGIYLLRVVTETDAEEARISINR